MSDRIPLVDLAAQYRVVKADVDAAIHRVLDQHQFILGPEVEEFERAFAAFCGSSDCVGVASGTAALRLALEACGVSRGDEVVTVSHTFFATVEAILQLGAIPRFVDIDPVSFTMDMDQLETVVRVDRDEGRHLVKAVVPVHLYGHPADMSAMRTIADRWGLRVIEDAAQAHGAEWNGRRCGGLGDLACFSFFPAKNLGAYGDAGAVTGNDTRLLERVRRLRDHGRSGKYEHQESGWGERLDALQAAVLSAKLGYLEEWTAARRSHAASYQDLLVGLDLGLPKEAPEARHVYHLYVIRTRRRDDLRSYLNDHGVDAGVHYPIPVHAQAACQRFPWADVHLPHTVQAAATVLSLPLFPEMTRDQLVRIQTLTTQFLECRAVDR